MFELEFEIKKFDANARIGVISHNGKKLITPNLLPVVSPFENIIPPQEIMDIFGGGAVFTNAYILYNKLNKEQKFRYQDIHETIDYNGLIATDSGAFQHYMYGNQDDISAEEIETFQQIINSDFPVILDLPVQISDTRDVAVKKVTETIIRAKQNLSRRNNEACKWFGPIHGGRYLDLVRKSVEEMNKLDFPINAIGGVVKTFNDYMFDVSTNIILTVRRFLRSDRPLHLFGAGLPQFFALSVACGIDLMDSAAYMLFAKQGRYFTLTGTRSIFNMLELPCHCPVCCKYEVQEIQELFAPDSSDEDKDKIKNTGIELIARHNLYVSFAELKKIREAIRNGTLWNLVEQRVHAHPRLIKAYDLIPKYWNALEIMEPLQKKKALSIYGEISKNRPIFYRIAKKHLNNYHLADRCNLILLPELDSTYANSPTMKNWIRTLQGKNLEISKNDNNEQIFSINLISNLFGIIPLNLSDIYPLSQREWHYGFQRTDYELFSLLKYQNLNPYDIINFDKKKIELSDEYFERHFGSNNKDSIQFDKIMENPSVIISSDDILNRIEICIRFLKKNKHSISKLIILRPSTYLDENGIEMQLNVHLIDDLIEILKKNDKILKKNTELVIKSKIEEIF